MSAMSKESAIATESSLEYHGVKHGASDQRDDMAKTKVHEGVMTNVEFAEAVGIHFSMASKLRHGTRSPGVDTLIGIWKAFDLPAEDLLRALDEGNDAFAQYLRHRVFREGLAA